MYPYGPGPSCESRQEGATVKMAVMEESMLRAYTRPEGAPQAQQRVPAREKTLLRGEEAMFLHPNRPGYERSDF
jgi:hypothetical protein